MKLSSKKSIGIAERMCFANLGYLLLVQFAVAVSFSLTQSGVDLAGRSALVHTIPHVVRTAANEQVVGPDTSRVVAVVADMQTFGNGSVVEYPASPGSQSASITLASITYGRPYVASPLLPVPASVRFDHASDETLWKCDRESFFGQEFRRNEFWVKTPSNQFFGCHLRLDNTKITQSQPRTSPLTV